MGKRSDHWLFAIALSRRQCTRCVCLWPLQERKFPVCCMSNRSKAERRLLKAPKEFSVLTGPPSFSELSTISLKSPVRNQGESFELASDDNWFQTSCSFGISGAP